MNVKKQGCVALRLFAKSILPGNNHQLLAEVADPLDDPYRVEGGGGSQVDVEDLLSVPDQAPKVDREHHL